MTANQPKPRPQNLIMTRLKPLEVIYQLPHQAQIETKARQNREIGEVTTRVMMANACRLNKSGLECRWTSQKVEETSEDRIEVRQEDAEMIIMRKATMIDQEKVDQDAQQALQALLQAIAAAQERPEEGILGWF